MPIFGYDVSDERFASALTVLAKAGLAERGIELTNDGMTYLQENIQTVVSHYEEAVRVRSLVRSDLPALDEYNSDISPFGVAFFNIGRLTRAMEVFAASESRTILDEGSVSQVMAGLCPLPPIC